MSKQSIYLDDDFEDKIRAIAFREGRSISDVIRKRVEWSFKYEDKELSLKKLQNNFHSLFVLMEVLADEISYVSGATRESTKSRQEVHIRSVENVERIQKIAKLLRKSFVEDNTRTDY